MAVTRSFGLVFSGHPSTQLTIKGKPSNQNRKNQLLKRFPLEINVVLYALKYGDARTAFNKKDGFVVLSAFFEVRNCIRE